MMKLSLAGKRAMVCGSTQGIGRAAAHELAGLGASITLVARDAARLEAVLRELPSAGGQEHDVIAADFADPDALGEKVRALGRKVHVLVNNTGGPPGGPIAEAEPGAFGEAFTRHLVCNHVLMQAVVAGMKSERFGRIVNIVSTSVRQPIKGLGVSNTIRAAVAGWAKTLAGELGPFGITVNNVLPGATRTTRLDGLLHATAARRGVDAETVSREMIAEIPVGRFAEPREIAFAIAFLASPAASYINGVSLAVDGGRILAL